MEPLCGAYPSSTRWPGPQTLYCRTGGSALVCPRADGGTGGGLRLRGMGPAAPNTKPSPKHTRRGSRDGATAASPPPDAPLPRHNTHQDVMQHQGRKRGRCRARTRVFPLTHPLATLGGGPTSSTRSPRGPPTECGSPPPPPHTDTPIGAPPPAAGGSTRFRCGDHTQGRPPTDRAVAAPAVSPIRTGAHTNRPAGMHRVMPAVKGWPANGVRRLQRADDQKDWFSPGGVCVGQQEPARNGTNRIGTRLSGGSAADSG